MKLPTVGVFFGSRSTEHDVSIITALAAAIKPLQLSGAYDVLPVYIAKDGKWYADKELADIGLYTTGKIDDWLKSHQPVTAGFEDGLVLYSKGGWRDKRMRIDVAFPALHGTHGEDGEVMGIFEMAGVPFVGCGVAASAIAMDKVLTKLVAQSSGIPVTNFQHFMKHEYEADPDEWVTRINRSLKYPLFVKPAHLGSSIGITKVSDPKDLANAIEVALHYDDRAIVEEGVSDLTEVTLPVMGNERPVPAKLEQPVFHGEEFFDFETKYMHGGKKGGKMAGKGSGAKGAHGYSRIPADLSEDLYAKAEGIGLQTYTALGCSGLARIDMLIDNKTQQVYCNEVNPLPGSLYQHNWNQAGISDVDLVVKLVGYAQERFEKRRQLETSFSTNFLKQF